jgi:hypothetical protein
MKTSEKSHFNIFYARHLKLLKLRGLSDSTIAGYSRAIRRISTHYGSSPDHLSTDQLEDYFFLMQIAVLVIRKPALVSTCCNFHCWSSALDGG